MHARAAEAWIAIDDPPHRLEQRTIVLRTTRRITLRCTWLPEHPADAAFGNVFGPQLATHFEHGSTASLGA